MIRVLVVDDEPLAREELTRLIRGDRDFSVVGEAGNGSDALQKIKVEKPDVVFMDIEMPGLNGLEVASRLTEWEKPPLVVFATAYHQYAIEAFEAHAIDYVLKPYPPVRLEKTFAHLKELLDSRVSSREKLILLEEEMIRKGKLKKLVGRHRNAKDRIVIDPSEVDYFSVKYSEIIAHLGDQELIVNATLQEVMGCLDPERFAQTHKSHIVNLDRVEKVAPMFSGNFELILKGAKPVKIPLSRRYARHLKSRLGNW